MKIQIGRFEYNHFLSLQVGTEPNVVLFFECPEAEMVKRVLDRNEVPVYYIVFDFSYHLRFCFRMNQIIYSSVSQIRCFILQGRVDDNIETIKKRLKVFEELNLPVINYYSEKGKVFKVYIQGLKLDFLFRQ